jgi:hypothetical protein
MGSKLEIDNIVAASGLNLTSPTVPSSVTDTGTAGDISWDSNYIYVCTATNAWKRTAALSSWLPDIAGLQLWLDADDSDTITLNGGTVSQWNDKSGNGYNVSQSTASNQPTYTASALNGKSVVRFDGGDELNGSATVVGGSTNRTVFVVFNCNNFGTTPAYGVTLGDSTSNGESFGVSREIAVRVNSGYRTWTTAVDSTHAIVTIVLDGTSTTGLSAWKNGSILTANLTSARTLNTAAGFIVGNGTAGGELNGDVAEIIVYNSALSTSDRQSVESYLSIKWGIS